MKVISENEFYTIYRDTSSIIKVGPPDAIQREAAILERLSGIHGVPHLKAVTPMMGTDNKRLSLIIDYCPGEPLSKALPMVPSGWVLNSLYAILSAMYSRGVCHGRITPDHVICTEDGITSIVGFSKAYILNNAPEEYVSSSPDICGVFNNRLFTFNVPVPEVEVDAGYNKISRFLQGVAT